MSLAQEIYNEFAENKQIAIDEQFDEIVDMIKDNAQFNRRELRYFDVLFDEVRQRLEKEGFNVETTIFEDDSIGYSITLNKSFINEEAFNDGESSKGEII